MRKIVFFLLLLPVLAAAQKPAAIVPPVLPDGWERSAAAYVDPDGNRYAVFLDSANVAQIWRNGCPEPLERAEAADTQCRHKCAESGCKRRARNGRYCAVHSPVLVVTLR